MSSKYYFAYGLNMNIREMEKRCPGASLLGVAKLSGYRFIINARGVATVVPAQSCQVYGILWRIIKSDEDILDDFEGVRWGVYRKEVFNVETLKGGSVLAMAYVADDDIPGAPRGNYLQSLIASAKQHRLPDTYIEELKSWLQKTEDWYL